MPNRSGKFYRNNEKDVMQMLGLNPTPNSGSGWIIKEDGQNENVICQLKSTDAQSIKINLIDIEKLFYNASVVHKIPVFAIQFINSGDVFILVKPTDLTDVSKYIETGKKEESEVLHDVLTLEELPRRKTKLIKSSSSAREQFEFEREERFRKKGKKAK